MEGWRNCVYLECAASDGLNAENKFQCVSCLTNKDSSSSSSSRETGFAPPWVPKQGLLGAMHCKLMCEKNAQYAIHYVIMTLLHIIMSRPYYLQV